MTEFRDADFPSRVEVRLTRNEQDLLETADIVFGVYPGADPDTDVSLIIKGAETVRHMIERGECIKGRHIAVIGVPSIDAAHVLRCAVDQGLVPPSPPLARQSRISNNPTNVQLYARLKAMGKAPKNRS